MRPQAWSEAVGYNTPELESLILKTEIIIFWKKIKTEKLDNYANKAVIKSLCNCVIMASYIKLGAH